MASVAFKLGRAWPFNFKRPQPRQTGSILERSASKGAGTFLSPQILLGVLIALFLQLIPVAHAEIGMPTPPKGERRKKEPAAPQAVDQRVTVALGGIARVPLRVYGLQGQSVRYLIRSQPQLGKILGIQQTSQEAWVLSYQHTSPMAGSADLHDRFTYVAQDDNGTSAPAEIDIAIVDDPPLLTAPNSVDFGDVTLGSTNTRTITIANRGGHVLEGDFAIEAPWSITPSHYRLGRGEEARFQVVLTASNEQEYRSQLRFPDWPRGATILHAMAFAAVTVAPIRLELVATGTEADAQRLGNLTLSNRTGLDQTVRIDAPARLHLPEEIIVPANGTNTVSAALSSDDTAGIDEPVQFYNGGSTQRVRVHSLPVLPTGPWLRAEPEALAFGKVEVGHPKSLRLHLENTGGTDAMVTAEVPPPFQLSRSTFPLASGTAIDLLVDLEPAWSGVIAATLKFHADGANVALPLSAEITPRVILTGTGSTKGAALTGAALAETGAAAVSEKTGPAPSSFGPVTGMELGRVTAGTAELSWNPPAKSGSDLNYRIEVRRLALNENGSVQVVWIPLPTVELKKTPERINALLTKLPPGIGITVHVISITPNRAESAPSEPFQFFVPPAIVIFTFQRVMLALCGTVLVGALWIRRKQNSMSGR